MRYWLVAFICLNSFCLFAADEPDVSGDYQCTREGSQCDPDYAFSYDSKTQFVTGEGPSWKVSGYVIRQEAKKTGNVYLVLPEAISLSKEVITFWADGKVSSRDGQFTCSLTKKK